MSNIMVTSKVTNSDIDYLKPKTPFEKPEKVFWPPSGSRPIPGVRGPSGDSPKIEGNLLQLKEYKIPPHLRQTLISGF